MSAGEERFTGAVDRDSCKNEWGLGWGWVRGCAPFMTGGCAVRAPGSLRDGRDRWTEWEGTYRERTSERVEKTGEKGRAVVVKGGKGERVQQEQPPWRKQWQGQ